jgi:ABC-2 type transport system permease protein
MTTITTTQAVDQTLRTALSGRPRPRRPGALSASLTFAWRAPLKFKHVPEQLIHVVGIPVIFTLMFTCPFGGGLAGSSHRACAARPHPPTRPSGKRQGGT